MANIRRGSAASVRGGNYRLGDKVVVCAPATSANLGCGFDSFGIALDLWTELEVTVSTEFKFAYEQFRSSPEIGTPTKRRDENNGRSTKSEGQIQVDFCSVGENEVPLSELLYSRDEVRRGLYRPLPINLPLDGSNAIVKAFMIGLRHSKSLPPEPLKFEFTCRTEVPISRGLGSSAAACVVGIAAAFCLCNKDLGDPAVLEELSVLACRIEGHPDNILPSIYGKMQIAVRRTEEDDKWMIDPSVNSDYIRQSVEFPSEEIECLIHVPKESLSTEIARNLLPHQYSKEDTISNIGRSGLLVAALLSGDFQNLKFACQDKIHQPYRASLCPCFTELQNVAPGTDALAIYLSGAGPSTVVWARSTEIHQLYVDMVNLLGNALSGHFIFAKVSYRGVYCKRQGDFFEHDFRPGAK